MTLAELKDGIRNAWQGFNVADEQIDHGLMTWERDLVAPHIGTGTRVLVIGCGTGRDLVGLAELGCEVTGVEPAGFAVDVARRALRRRGLRGTLVEGFFEDAAIPGQFDVVMFSWFSYALMPQSRRRSQALRKAASLVRPGGPILVSYRRTGRRSGHAAVTIRLARALGAVSRSDWRLEPGDGIYLVTFADRTAYAFEHAFRPTEMAREAHEADVTLEDLREVPSDELFAVTLRAR
jgi:SAM-dependent methyltransferase